MPTSLAHPRHHDGHWRSAQSAVLRIAQNELDLRLLYQRVIDVDLARLALWVGQLSVDVAAADMVRSADVAALERVWARTSGRRRHRDMDTALDALRRCRRRRRPSRGRPCRGEAGPIGRGTARPLTQKGCAKIRSCR